MKNKGLQVKETVLKLPKGMQKRLQEKLYSRNEDLILDYLEQIQSHKRAIAMLLKKIKILTTNSYLDSDEDIWATEEGE